MTRLRVIPQPGTLDLVSTLILSDIFNRSNFEYRVFSSLKVESGRRKKKKKERRCKTGKIVFKVGQTNIPKKKAVDSVLKNHTPFSSKSVITEIYRFKLVKFFAHFRLATFWSRDRAPPNSVCIKHL